MSRQSQITEALRALIGKGAIQSFHKGQNAAEPNRLEWYVQVNRSNFYLNSREVEAFINGAKSILNVVERLFCSSVDGKPHQS